MIIKSRYISSWKRTNTGIRTYFNCRKNSINFTEKNKRFCLSLHYSGANSYLFVNGKEIIKFKAKDSEIVASPLCLGNISKNWSTDNMEKTGLNGYVYKFNVDYRYLNPSEIPKSMPLVHKYLMGKYNIK